MLRNLILGYPTWCSCSNWAVKTIVPLPEGEQIIILQALVGLRKVGYQSNNIEPGLEVISPAGKGMTLVMLGEP